MSGIYGLEEEFGLSLTQKTSPQERDWVVARLLGIIADRGRAIAPNAFRVCQSTPLGNGGLFYNDRGYLEGATPECASALQCLTYMRAGERIALDAEQALRSSSNDGRIIRNNTDSHGRSNGTHDNYFMPDALAYGGLLHGSFHAEIETLEKHLRIEALTTQSLETFLVVRSPIVGAGLVRRKKKRHVFMITQRARVIEQRRSLSATHGRAIINIRREPHAENGERLHSILGDATCCDVSTYLKIGMTSIMLRIIQEASHLLWELPRLVNPVGALHRLSLNHPVPWYVQKFKVRQGNQYKKCTVLEILGAYQEAAYKFLRDAPTVSDEEMDVLGRWCEIAHTLGLFPAEEAMRKLVGVLDWVTKLMIIRGHMRKYGFDFNSHPESIVEVEGRRINVATQVRSDDLQYHGINPEWGFAARMHRSGRMPRLVSDEEIISAVCDPPFETRAYARAMVRKYGPQDGQFCPRFVGWRIVEWPDPDEPFQQRYLDLKDPRLFNEAHVGHWFNGATGVELLRQLAPYTTTFQPFPFMDEEEEEL